MNQFNEPLFVWEGVHRFLIFDAANLSDDGDNQPKAMVDANDFASMDEARKMAERITACINFCAGLETDFIQGQPLIGRPTLMGQPYVKKFNCAESLEQRDKLKSPEVIRAFQQIGDSLLREAQENANG